MGSTPLTAFALIGLGVRDLSVAPRSVSLMKRMIRGISARDAADAAESALRCVNAADAETLLRSRLERTTAL
jgi:signal transduction protein with GAF and PtsI domain